LWQNWSELYDKGSKDICEISQEWSILYDEYDNKLQIIIKDH